MELEEMINLIRPGVEQGREVWADLGAGTGNFSRALAVLLGPTATIYAVDRSPSVLARLQAGAHPQRRLFRSSATSHDRSISRSLTGS